MVYVSRAYLGDWMPSWNSKCGEKNVDSCKAELDHRLDAIRPTRGSPFWGGIEPKYAL
jgi:hypothetical protein